MVTVVVVLVVVSTFVLLFEQKLWLRQPFDSVEQRHKRGALRVSKSE